MTAVTKPNFKPQGYHSVTPYLVIDGAANAIDFYKKVFGATEIMRMPAPGGNIGHAELKFGDSPVMMADEFPQMGYKSAKTMGGSPMSIMFYVENVDAVIQHAVANGATLIKPVQDQFYGDRSGTVTDPFGYSWNISTHIEDVTPEEMQKRMKAMSGA
ncbi:MAG: Glyoxalase/bleomycin resistance protein/dioxygenase [Acidobacteriales bacterium]|nr:Glyoxalase/bleomycin resistance protein/dioxygenase [Terriglobales bacterium]